MSEEREDLFRYLDAKFEGVETRILGLQTLWDAETKASSLERMNVLQRLVSLENWRAGLAAAIAVVAFLLSGIPGWVGKLFAATGVK